MLLCEYSSGGLLDLLAKFAPIGTAFGVVVAGLTYWWNVRQKRSELMLKLYEKFYEGTLHKDMRRRIDYRTLENDLAADPLLEEKLVDYLNFFEFMASMWSLGQLKAVEIEKLFAYYLDLIASSEYLSGYLRKNGFEDMERYMAQRGQKG